MKRHGMMTHNIVEPMLSDFDELDADDIAFLTRVKRAHDPEPDPIIEAHTRYHSLNFGDLS